MNFAEQIAPFYWVEHEGSAAVCLSMCEEYKANLFKTREKEMFTGSGDDWASLALTFIQEKSPDLLGKIDFDPEHSLFCAFSTDRDALQKFILLFKETCENDHLIADVFSRTPSPEHVSDMDLESVLGMFLDRDITENDMKEARDMLSTFDKNIN